MSAAKERAKLLVARILPIVRNSDLFDTYLTKAKKCALMVVNDSIIQLNSIKHPMNSERTNRRIRKKIHFLLEVKLEIEKL